MHFDKPLVKYMKKVLKEDKENNRFYSSKSSCIIMKMSDTEGTEDRYLRGYYIKKEPCRGTIFVTDRKQKSMVFAVLSAQFSSVAQSCLTLCNPMNRSRPGLPVYHHLPEFTQTHVHQVGDAIQPSHPLSTLLLLPPIPPSIRDFSNESTLRMRWPKYWSFSCGSVFPRVPSLASFMLSKAMIKFLK